LAQTPPVAYLFLVRPKAVKKLGVVIFIVGILVSVCAFVADKVDHIPAMLKLLAPGYIRAQTAIEKLKTAKTLEPSNAGFAEISKLFFERAARENSPKLLATMSIQKLTRQGAIRTYGELQVNEIVPVEVELSNGQKVQWDLKQIKAQATSLKESRLFHFSVGFFVLGLIIATAGFAIDHFCARSKV